MLLCGDLCLKSFQFQSMDVELLLYLTFGNLELFHLLSLSCKLQLVILDQNLCLSDCSSSTRYHSFCALGNNLGSLKIICQVLIAGLEIVKTTSFLSYPPLNILSLPFLIGVEILGHPLSISNHASSLQLPKLF